jgi:predicted RNA binding protein YcfA (HicA-like mRNA interferase family)
MVRLPVLKPREVVRALERLGFVEVRQRGAHRQFRHLDGRGTTVPLYRKAKRKRNACETSSSVQKRNRDRGDNAQRNEDEERYAHANR